MQTSTIIILAKNNQSIPYSFAKVKINSLL